MGPLQTNICIISVKIQTNMIIKLFVTAKIFIWKYCRWNIGPRIQALVCQNLQTRILCHTGWPWLIPVLLMPWFHLSINNRHNINCNLITDMLVFVCLGCGYRQSLSCGQLMRIFVITCTYLSLFVLGFNQRCVVRGIALSSLLSCRLPANLNSRGSSVAPTWAHLCWPGSRSVHGSIHSCVIGRPRYTRRDHPKHCLGCLAWSRRPPSVNES